MSYANNVFQPLPYYHTSLLLGDRNLWRFLLPAYVKSPMTPPKAEKVQGGVLWHCFIQNVDLPNLEQHQFTALRMRSTILPPTPLIDLPFHFVDNFMCVTKICPVREELALRWTQLLVNWEFSTQLTSTRPIASETLSVRARGKQSPCNESRLSSN